MKVPFKSQKKPRLLPRPPAHPWPSAMRHLLLVAGQLRAGLPFNCTTLGAEIDLDPKTVHRDILLLRDHGWKIEYDEVARE